jgi:hypothetical protein
VAAPAGHPSAAAATAILPSQPTWLGKVRQQTLFTTFPSEEPPAARPSERSSRQSGRSTAKSSAPHASPRRRPLDVISVPIVVVSAAILLVAVAAVMLATRRSEPSLPKQDDEAPSERAVAAPVNHEYPGRGAAASPAPPRPAPTAEREAQRRAPEGDPGSDQDGRPSRISGAPSAPSRTTRDKDKESPKRFW